MDSSYAARKVMQDSFPNRSNDTMHMIALPPVMEGDLVFQILDNPFCNRYGKIFGSKYNNIGIIFIRQRDKLYIVISALDSVKPVPLTEWVDAGVGDHVALMRLKNANKTLTEKRTDKLRTALKAFKAHPLDQRLSWTDDAVYPSELAWKAYHNGLKIDLCTPKKLTDYNKDATPGEEAVSPDDLYNSPKLELIYER
jgi:hypothetical protein